MKEWLLCNFEQRLPLARRSRVTGTKCKSEFTRWGTETVIVLQWSTRSLTVRWIWNLFNCGLLSQAHKYDALYVRVVCGLSVDVALFARCKLAVTAYDKYAESRVR